MKNARYEAFLLCHSLFDISYFKKKPFRRYIPERLNSQNKTTQKTTVFIICRGHRLHLIH